MEQSNDKLELLESRLNNLETAIQLMRNDIEVLTESLKETQRYLVNMATTQNAIAKRVSHWPYIPVEKEHRNGEE